MSDLISREELKRAFAEECCGSCDICLHSLTGYKCELIENAPTVEPDKELKEKAETYKNAYRIMSDAFESEVKKHTRPQGECEKCDYRKFTETFIDGVVDVMNKNGITSVEQLQEILKGGAEK